MITVAILARNEAKRDLSAVLANAVSFADQILLLDDASVDATPEIAKAAGAKVRTRKSPKGMWGKESGARRELWEWGAGAAKDGWLLIQDADQILVGDPRPLARSWDVNTWCFALYDLWSETHYREDQFWQGHRHPRPWMFAPKRVPTGWVAQWPDRGIHPGHAPMNFPMVVGVAPPDLAHWRHRAYIDPLRRQLKAAQYRSQWDQLTPFERAHVQSITDLDIPQ